MTLPSRINFPVGVRVWACLSVSFWVPVSRVGTGRGRSRQLNSFIIKHIWEQNWGIRLPAPSPAHPSYLKAPGTARLLVLQQRWEQRERSARGTTKGTTNSYCPKLLGGTEQCGSSEPQNNIRVILGAEKKKKAMSFKVLVMLLFGFSRNKSKARPFALNPYAKNQRQKHPVNLAVVLPQEYIKNTSFSTRKSTWFSRKEISISIFYSKKSTACLWKDQCPK